MQSGHLGVKQLHELKKMDMLHEWNSRLASFLFPSSDFK